MKPKDRERRKCPDCGRLMVLYATDGQSCLECAIILPDAKIDELTGLIGKGRDYDELYTEALKTAKECGRVMIERDDAVRLLRDLTYSRTHPAMKGSRIQVSKEQLARLDAFLAHPKIKEIGGAG